MQLVKYGLLVLDRLVSPSIVPTYAIGLHFWFGCARQVGQSCYRVHLCNWFSMVWLCWTGWSALLSAYAKLSISGQSRQMPAPPPPLPPPLRPIYILIKF